MGAALHTLRNQVTAGNEQEKQEILERLDLMEELAQARLKVAANEILNGVRGDQQIHFGKVVLREERISVNTKKYAAAGEKINDILTPFFKLDIIGGLSNLLQNAADIVLGNVAAGKIEQHKHLLTWENNAVILIDIYMYSYTFRSKQAIDDSESVVAALLMKRVVPLDSKDLDIGVLMYAINDSFDKLGFDDEEKVKRIAAIQDQYARLRGLAEKAGVPTKSGNK